MTTVIKKNVLEITLKKKKKLDRENCDQNQYIEIKLTILFFNNRNIIVIFI